MSAQNDLKKDFNTSRSRKKPNRTDSDMSQKLLINGIEEDEVQVFSNLKGDRRNVAVLLLLYILQGIPLGLSAAVPMLLQNRGISYTQQAEFSFAFWPFSMKLLWAPIVDSLYVERWGRRKSWLIPVQYLLGFFMLYLSFNVENWLGLEGNNSPSIEILAICFFILNVLAATQDIAVDGWALTMLKRENVGHASTCNSVGQTIGYFLGYVIFLALESQDFSNAYIRSNPGNCGVVTLDSFLFFWGIIFLVVTTLIGIFKKEQKPRYGLIEPKVDVTDTYKELFHIIQLPKIRTLAAVLLTSKIAFSACDSVTSLKLIDSGVPKEKFAMMAVVLVPLQMVLPIILSKYTTGRQPMNIYVKAIPYRLGFNIIAALFVWITPHIIHGSNIPFYYTILLFITLFLHQITLFSMFVAVMGFFARISDPALGGTYMTLLNTMANLGGNWPSTLALFCVDKLTRRSCTNMANNTCSSPESVKGCEKDGGTCLTWLDGYYLETLVCTLFGYFWLVCWGRRTIFNLQSSSPNEWKVNKLVR
uniref:Major facilitator superfamily (MFS) profile domain-containing protein n=1 Tax=Clastoptera arizonana TaxID=38151 RepID=A0A1B6CC51_9HEMI